jgi:predicted RNA-binding Zn-ribbon protein involved in translation (DUF1610 family)
MLLPTWTIRKQKVQFPYANSCGKRIVIRCPFARELGRSHHCQDLRVLPPRCGLAPRVIGGATGIMFASSCPRSASLHYGPPRLHIMPWFFILCWGGMTAITSSRTPRYRLPARGQPGLMTPLPSRLSTSPAFRYRLRATCGGRGPTDVVPPATAR